MEPEKKRRIDPVVASYMKDVDRTQLRENLKLTPEQRLDKLMSHQRFAEEVRRAGAVARAAAKSAARQGAAS